MKEFAFILISPAGNDTVFLACDDEERDLGRQYCADALKLTGAEQAGLASFRQKSFVMAGGEFCLNACRAFGAGLDYYAKSQTKEPRIYEARTSGISQPVRLMVRGASPAWMVTAQIRGLEPKEISADANAAIVALPGIAHLLLKADNFPANPVEEAARHRRRHNMGAHPADGVVWWRLSNDVYEILPHVEVREPFTSVLETSCASATLALAFTLGKKGEPIRVRQPGGDPLTVLIRSDEVEVSGPATLRAEGRAFLKKI